MTAQATKGALSADARTFIAIALRSLELSRRRPEIDPERKYEDSRSRKEAAGLNFTRTRDRSGSRAAAAEW
jgi:hypothetical protein